LLEEWKNVPDRECETIGGPVASTLLAALNNCFMDFEFF
jgi:hypothetical protein